MNFKSQLEWFYTFPNIVEASSGLPKIKWQTANRAKANIMQISTKHQENKEAAIAFILYQNLQDAVQGDLVLENWTAFLSRYSEKAAYQVRRTMLTSNMKSIEESAAIFEDHLLIALSFAVEPISFLKDFNSNKESIDTWYRILHGYCRKTAWGKLVDRLRTKEGSRTFMRSNLGLAVKYSETKVTQSLILVGIKDAELEKYLFIWRCVVEVKKAHGINIKALKQKDFQLVVERINYLLQKKESDRLLLSTPVLSDTVETCLKQIGKAVRFYIDRPTLSFDKSASQDNQTSLLDLTSDDASNNDLASVEQTSAMDKIAAQVYSYLDRFDSAQWLVMFLREEADLKQIDIATMMGCTQKTVSKKYRKSWQGLLEEILAKFQPNTETSTPLSSETITDLKEGLKSIVKSYFQFALHNYLQSSVSKGDRSTNQQLLEFLESRSNKKLTVNSDIQQKLDNFIETTERLSDA